MEFKKLELESEGRSLTKIFKSKHTRRTIIAILIGAVAGFALFYFSEGKYLEIITAGQVLKSIAIGGFFGFFITNSPCARGMC